MQWMESIQTAANEQQGGDAFYRKRVPSFSSINSSQSQRLPNIRTPIGSGVDSPMSLRTPARIPETPDEEAGYETKEDQTPVMQGSEGDATPSAEAKYGLIPDAGKYSKILDEAAKELMALEKVGATVSLPACGTPLMVYHQDTSAWESNGTKNGVEAFISAKGEASAMGRATIAHPPR